MIAWFPWLALTATSITAFLVYVSLRQRIVAPTLKQLDNVSDVKEEQLNRWFSNQKQMVLKSSQILSESPILAESLEAGEVSSQQSQQIETLLSDLDLFSRRYSVALLNHSSIIVYATDQSKQGQYQPIQNSSTYLSPNNLTQFVPNFYASSIDGVPMITFATPLINEEGERIGFLAVDLDLDALNQRVRQSPYSNNVPPEIRSALETYLVGRISPVENELVAQSQSSASSDQSINSFGIDRAILGRHSVFRSARQSVAWIYGVGLSLTAVISLFLYLIQPSIITITQSSQAVPYPQDHSSQQ
ncbi:cache domain-containing protein [Halothece sp. PCC 7418]|uniref:cache domain-containing protein n=1 Tax=Halothece sp. (strain PCC 7418) TaxID=65093 RepID=UPI0002FCB757|nr:cache domain-containing protein [Halothece sp. PCC 7418]